MSHLLLELPANRSQCGTLRLVDDRARVICGPFPVAGRASDLLAAARGNPSRNPILRFGDTPCGSYRVRGTLKSGKATPFATPQFGPHGVVVLEAISGDAALAEANGRFHLLIIGGRPAKDGALRSTSGSLRLSNDNQRTLVVALRDLPGIPCHIIERAPGRGARNVFDDPQCRDDDPVGLLLSEGWASRNSLGREVVRGSTAGAVALGLSVSFVALQTPSTARASEPPAISVTSRFGGPVSFVPPAALPSRNYTRLAYGPPTTGGDNSGSGAGSNSGYGIPGLPGIYTGGPSDNGSGGAAPPAGGGTDNGGAAPPAGGGTDNGGAGAGSNSGYGIPGLPGIYTGGPRDDGGGATPPAAGAGDNNPPAAGAGDQNPPPPEAGPTDNGAPAAAPPPPDNEPPPPAATNPTDSGTGGGSNASDNGAAPEPSGAAPPPDNSPAPGGDNGSGESGAGAPPPTSGMAPLTGSEIPDHDAPAAKPSGGGTLEPFSPNAPPQNVGPTVNPTPPSGTGDTNALHQLQGLGAGGTPEGGAQPGIDTYGQRGGDVSPSTPTVQGVAPSSPTVQGVPPNTPPAAGTPPATNAPSSAWQQYLDKKAKSEQEQRDAWKKYQEQQNQPPATKPPAATAPTTPPPTTPPAPKPHRPGTPDLKTDTDPTK